MGVTGLWRLIEPSGKPVPLETLENKVLAVDISIWLHQAIKGFQDAKGASLPNAHLLGIYHRVCKLLYFRIKPVFVFDGGVPALKKQTIMKRNQQKSKHLSEADRIRQQLISTLLKHSAISKVISEKARASLEAEIKTLPKSSSRPDRDDMFKLPEMEQDFTHEENEEETSDSSDTSPAKHWNLHTIDEKSPHFRSLPPDVRHEILTELKETRKQSSWHRIHEIPKESGDFSNYQMKRLLKRYSIQMSLEEAEKEMGGHCLSLVELEAILRDQGIVSKEVGRRIASDEDTRFLFIKDVKKAMEEAKKLEERKKELESEKERAENGKETSEPSISKDTEDEELQLAIQLSLQNKPKEEEETKPHSEDEDLQKAIQLSLQSEPGPSEQKIENSSNRLDLSILNSSEFRFSSDSEEELPDKHKETLNLAKNYMMEYSGLTPSAIEDIISSNAKKGKKDLKRQLSSLRKKSEEKLVDISKTDSKVSKDKFNDVNEKQNEPCTISREKDNKEVPNNKEEKLIDISKTDSKFSEDKLNDVNEKKNEPGTISKEKDNKEIPNSKENIENSENTKKDVETGEVEFMSDSDTSSEDFSEMLSNNDKHKTGSGSSFEITIKPSDSLEDDIFKDIFSETINEKTDSKLLLEKQNALPTIPEETEESTEKETDIELTKPKAEEKKSVPLEQTKENEDEELQMAIQLSLQTETESEVPSESLSNKLEEKESGAVLKEQTLSSTSPEKLISEAQATKLTSQQNKEKVIGELLKSLKKAQSARKDEDLSTEQLKEIQENLLQEQRELISEKSSKERLATNITEQMYEEAQELLQLFGVPYIIAPMEAEAQCAFLNSMNLVDGTITDDSDIWLFGGRTVYKNFFNQNKHVMEFRAENIQHHFKLTREQMILLALLVGSDYTVGLQGIGPVTALEILAAFPPPKTAQFSLSHQQLLAGLSEFRNWLSSDKYIPGKNTLRKKLKNVVFTDNFPSYQVVQAYLDPKVDDSKEPFSWAKPDIVALTDFAKTKFGWTRQKSEEILKPVLKRMDEKHLQKSIRDYFKTKYKLHSTEAENRMSKRVQKAVKRIGKGDGDTSGEEDESKKQKKRSKRTEGKSSGKGKVKKSKQKGKAEKIILENKGNEEDNKAEKTKLKEDEDDNKGGRSKQKQETEERDEDFRQKRPRSEKSKEENVNLKKDIPDTKEDIDADENTKRRKSSRSINKDRKRSCDDENTVETKSKTGRGRPRKKTPGKDAENKQTVVPANQKLKSVLQSVTKTEKKTDSLQKSKISELDEIIQSTNDPLMETDESQTSEVKLDGKPIWISMDTEDFVKSSNQDLHLEANPSSSKTEPSSSKTGVESQPSTSFENLKRSKNSNRSNKKIKSDAVSDEELKLLETTFAQSKSKVEQIRAQLMEQINRSTRSPKEEREIIRDVSGPISPLDRLKIENIHKKEIIPQKQQDKVMIARRKMKAIEVFQTSKRKTNKKNAKVKRAPHTSTHYLSESSSDEDKGK